MDLRYAAAACFFIVAATAHAEGKVYRWTDAQGRVHYGDQPSGNAQSVAPKVPTLEAPAAGDTPAARKTASGAPPLGTCEEKKAQLASYRRAAKITETSALGETREYSAEQKQQLIERTEAAVKEACGTE